MSELLCITGASRGIGLALGQHMESAGWEVYGCARQPEQATFPAGFDLARVDMREEHAVRGWLYTIPIENGRVWHMVVNHGVLGPRRTVSTTSPADFAAVQATNSLGAFNIIHASLNHLPPPRVLVLVSSSVGRHGRGGWGAYAASKAVLESLCQTLAEELQAEQTLVFAFNPGGTATAMRAAAYPDEDPRTLPEPQAVAAVLAGLIMERDSDLHGASVDARDWF